MNILIRRLQENITSCNRNITRYKGYIKDTKWWEFKLRSSYRNLIKEEIKDIKTLNKALDKYDYNRQG